MKNHTECPKCNARFPGCEIPENHFCSVIGGKTEEKKTSFQLKHQARAIKATMEKFQGRISRTWARMGKPQQSKTWQDTAELLSDMQVMHDILEICLPYAPKEVLEQGEKIAMGTEQDEDDGEEG